MPAHAAAPHLELRTSTRRSTGQAVAAASRGCAAHVALTIAGGEAEAAALTAAGLAFTTP